MKEVYIICPICKAVYPKDVDFCINCGTQFDKETIETIEKENEK